MVASRPYLTQGEVLRNSGPCGECFHKAHRRCDAFPTATRQQTKAAKDHSFGSIGGRVWSCGFRAFLGGRVGCVSVIGKAVCDIFVRVCVVLVCEKIVRPHWNWEE